MPLKTRFARKFTCKAGPGISEKHDLHINLRAKRAPGVETTVKYIPFGAPGAENIVKYIPFGAPGTENIVKYLPFGVPGADNIVK